mmetsp:Transcript_94817/g.267881  ORF Transcript_94817/g.267881 Transcript_94817/m.267881 type:complete len:338 (-) Transcript_94817:150-1163(-)
MKARRTRTRRGRSTRKRSLRRARRLLLRRRPRPRWVVSCPRCRLRSRRSSSRRASRLERAFRRRRLVAQPSRPRLPGTSGTSRMPPAGRVQRRPRRRRSRTRDLQFCQVGPRRLPPRLPLPPRRRPRTRRRAARRRRGRAAAAAATAVAVESAAADAVEMRPKVSAPLTALPLAGVVRLSSSPGPAVASAPLSARRVVSSVVVSGMQVMVQPAPHHFAGAAAPAPRGPYPMQVVLQQPQHGLAAAATAVSAPGQQTPGALAPGAGVSGAGASSVPVPRQLAAPYLVRPMVVPMTAPMGAASVGVPVWPWGGATPVVTGAGAACLAATLPAHGTSESK